MTLTGLGLVGDQRSAFEADRLELALDPQDALLPVNISPHQAQDLSFAHAGGQGQEEQRLQWLAQVTINHLIASLNPARSTWILHLA
jgi:hypothetical protein